MTAIRITFDTLKYVNELKKAGIEQSQAEAMARASNEAFCELLEIRDLSTKSDLNKLKLELQSFMLKITSLAVVVLGAIQSLFHFVGK